MNSNSTVRVCINLEKGCHRVSSGVCRFRHHIGIITGQTFNNICHKADRSTLVLSQAAIYVIKNCMDNGNNIITINIRIWKGLICKEIHNI